MELLSADVAAQKSAAMLVHSIGEVLTGHADTGPLPALKLLLVDEVPFLHAQKPKQYKCTASRFGGHCAGYELSQGTRSESAARSNQNE